MKDYDVTITETLEMTVTVNAASRMEPSSLSTSGGRKEIIFWMPTTSLV